MNLISNKFVDSSSDNLRILEKLYMPEKAQWSKKIIEENMFMDDSICFITKSYTDITK